MQQFLVSADSDGNGSLSKEEFKNGVAKLGLSDEDATAFANEVCFGFVMIMLISRAINSDNFSVLR